MKTCPISGCNTIIASSKFMCGKHWREVPQNFRDAIHSQAHEDKTSDAFKAELRRGIAFVNIKLQNPLSEK